MLTYAVFGGQTCENTLTSACDTCDILASGLQLTFLLNSNKFSAFTAAEWEAKVFINVIKSFNYALGNDYHTALDGPLEGQEYNQDVIDEVQALMK